MTQEQKDLLLKDICCRLPYGVKVQIKEVSDYTNEYLSPKIKTPWTNKDGESCGVITAPTISQVLKWLRDEKKIAINIEFIPYVWQYKIFDMSFKSRFEPCGLTLFSDYEEAALAGIEYVIDNLI
jgi:hypothetical protein